MGRMGYCTSSGGAKPPQEAEEFPGHGEKSRPFRSRWPPIADFRTQINLALSQWIQMTIVIGFHMHRKRSLAAALWWLRCFPTYLFG